MNKADKRKGKVRKKIPITMPTCSEWANLRFFFKAVANFRGNLYALIQILFLSAYTHYNEIVIRESTC